MSDYGDDSDYEVDYMWIEEEYSAADDLAERVVHSPPPTHYLDDDDSLEWDRFEYFNDLEYDSDGYDDVTFVPHKSKTAKATQRTGQKRKRNGTTQPARKRSKVESDLFEPLPGPVLPPVAWRSRETPALPIVHSESLKPVAFLRDWRRTMPTTPTWASGSNAPKTGHEHRTSEGTAPLLAKVDDGIRDAGDGQDRDGGSADMATVDPEALMAALEKNLAAAGGPLSGMDPQQLLQFAMRMMNDQGAGDDIAGELADDMLQQGAEEEGEDGEDDTELLSWLAKHRNSAQSDSVMADVNGTKMSKHKQTDHRPPTPSSLKDVESLADTDDVDTPAIPVIPPHMINSRKRKADDDLQDGESSMASSKKRIPASNDTSARGSQHKADLSSARNTRSGRAKRS